MTKQELYKKYKYIVAYHKATGSFDYYIEMQVNQAEEENAPKDAYCKIQGEWVTYDNTSAYAKELIDSKL